MGREIKQFNTVTGRLGEDLATDYLINAGYIIIERNFRAGRMGEIDIVAMHGNYLCFVEVKTRKGLQYGRPAEAVTWGKQRKIVRLASLYLAKNGMMKSNVRFDIVEVVLGGEPEVVLIQNAFM